MENQNKEKLVKKVKLVYSVELGIFSALFAVLGILILTEVISIADWKRIAFSYVTLVGGSWLIIDLIWMALSPKRRAKNSLFDKIVVAPAGLAALVFDIYVLSKGLVHIPDGTPTDPIFHFFIGADLCYLSLVYLAQIIYHWYRPLPSLLQAADEALKEEEEEAAKAAAEASKLEGQENEKSAEESENKGE